VFLGLLTFFLSTFFFSSFHMRSDGFEINLYVLDQLQRIIFRYLLLSPSLLQDISTKFMNIKKSCCS